ncbi:hypothetical protein AB0F81_41975 [Actinoplanes sp. NPDC024001]
MSNLPLIDPAAATGRAADLLTAVERNLGVNKAAAVDTDFPVVTA